VGIRLSSGRAHWASCGAAVAGPSHEESGTPRQDAFRIRSTDGVIVMAVADGAGSAELSQIGARLAANTASKVALARGAAWSKLSDSGAESALRNVLDRVAQQLVHFAMRADIAVDLLATTLSVAIVTDERWSCARVGDSPAVVRESTEGLRTIARTPGSQYINETTFMTSSDWREMARVEHGKTSEIDAIALLTDGVAFLGINLAADEPGPGFFNPVFDAMGSGELQPKDLQDLLNSPAARSRSDDDKAMTLAVRQKR
jgi:hypothetical protein